MGIWSLELLILIFNIFSCNPTALRIFLDLARAVSSIIASRKVLILEHQADLLLLQLFILHVYLAGLLILEKLRSIYQTSFQIRQFSHLFLMFCNRLQPLKIQLVHPRNPNHLMSVAPKQRRFLRVLLSISVLPIDLDLL